MTAEKKEIDTKILVFVCDGSEVIRAVNRLLKTHGLRAKFSGSYKELGDQRYISLEPIEEKIHGRD